MGLMCYRLPAVYHRNPAVPAVPAVYRPAVSAVPELLGL